MGSVWRSGRRSATCVMLLFLGVVLSGCLGTVELEAEKTMEPYKRISGWTALEGGGATCFLVSSVPPRWCVDARLQFEDFLCDPPQLVLATLDHQAAFQVEHLQRVDGDDAPVPEGAPADAYVHCEYALAWSVTGRSLPPDSRLHVVARHAGLEETSSCEIAFNSECDTNGRIEGTFTFNGADEELDLVALLHAKVVTAGPSGPVLEPLGGKMSKDLRLTLRT